MKTSKLQGCVATFVRGLIGAGARFETQKALAEATGMNPASVHACMKARRVEPDTLARLLSVLGEDDQRKLLTAAVIDAIPQPWVELLFAENVVRLDESASPVPPLADAFLKYLAVECRRDPAVLAMLEKQARWVGLDKEVEAR